MFTHPLTKEQLINTDVCPRHHVRLLMEEYGNPDTAILCPQCEQELERASNSKPSVLRNVLGLQITWQVAAGSQTFAFANERSANKFWATLIQRKYRRARV